MSSESSRRSSFKKNFIEQRLDDKDDNVTEDGYMDRVQSIICSAKFKAVFLMLLISMVCVPLVVYFFMDQIVKEKNETSTCLVNSTFRVSCGGVNISQSDCLNIHCCYDVNSQSCYHYLPSKYYYAINNNEYNPSITTTPFKNEMSSNIGLVVTTLNDNKVKIVLHNGSNTEQDSITESNGFNINKLDDPLMIEVKRNDEVLLTTSRGPLIMSENYWEWTLFLTEKQLFGLGETLIQLEKNESITKVIYPNKNNHNTPPVFWAFKNGNFHGIVIRHEGPVEVTVLSSNLIILRGLCPSDVEIELSIGGPPSFLRQLQNNVTLDYDIIDNILKTHICRFSDKLALTDLLDEYDMDDNFDSDCIHENLFLSLTNNPSPEEIENLKETITNLNKSFYLAIPPHVISSSDFFSKIHPDIFYQYNNENYIGKYLNQSVVYPDFSNPSVTEYMNAIEEVIKDYEDYIEGFILTKNWPQNDESMEITDTFPYLGEDLKAAITNTIPWNATTKDNVPHIYKHNTYGESMVEAFKNKFPDKTIISSSNSFGSFQPSILDNVDISWTMFLQFLRNILFNSAIGNYAVNLPVCGTNADYNQANQENLCMRLYLLAATLPGFTVTSVEPKRNPENFKYKFYGNIVERAMNIRKSFLPFYKTILSEGKPLVTPMFYYFYEDPATLSLDQQYMIGNNILIAHPMTMRQYSLNVYFPKGVWYEMWGGEIQNATVGGWHRITMVETDWIGFISEGFILSVVNDQSLTVTVALSSDKGKNATGSIILGHAKLTFSSTSNHMTISQFGDCTNNYKISVIKLFDETTTTYNDVQEDICTGQDVEIDYSSLKK